MIRSMTGYGKGEYENGSRKFTVEIKSVNHRYNDISIKLPRFMISLEDKIKKAVSQKIYRGKTDVFINYSMEAGDDVEVKLNESLAQSYVEKLNVLKENFGLTSGNTLDLVARFPEILTVEKVEEESDVLWETLEVALNEAIENFIHMREVEGEALKKDILAKNQKIREITDSIKERSPFVVEEYKEKLTARLAELIEKQMVDEQRMAAEITVFADKCCIDEELTRMYSHLKQLESILESEGSIGRKLDFLVQEMNREANTTASKSNDITITNATIELKTEIEKIREQIQNIE
ncbi:MAG: YicC family protein [Firmicutes bacterium]|nr:YicC family protein [Bacillota bacterium]